MESYLTGAADVVTGSGLSALNSADSGPGWAAGGAAVGLAVSYFEVYRRAPPFLNALFRIFLSSSQFFALWEGTDPDLGAGLVAVPLFFALCCAPVGSASEYLRRARLFCAVFNAVVLSAAGIYYKDTPSAPAAATAFDQELRNFLALFDVALAVAAAERWPSAAARGGVFVVLAAFPGLPASILRGQTPQWLLLLYGAALVQSAQVHSCSLRLELTAVADAQRSLMLLVACALAAGYVQRAGDPAVASFAALAVLSASVLSWAAQAKWVQRSE